MLTTMIIIATLKYTVSQKTRHHTIACYFAKCQPTFKDSLLNLAAIFLICNKIYHHALNAQLNYPVISLHTSGCRCFSDINILPNSVATFLRCGGMFIYGFIAN